MADYSTYFLMNEAEAAEYVRTRFPFFDKDAELEHSEIGDGNLNYIFRIADRKTGRSVVVKQSGDTARISDQFKVSMDRNRIEYEILKVENELAPGLVPKIYHYDPVMNCCVMEDLSDHTIMRDALLQRKTFPRFADDITTFMVNTLLDTTDVVMDHKEKKARVAKFINPDPCGITEDLVYTEPFNDVNNRNDVFPPNRAFVEKELYADKNLLLETAKLKFDFFCKAQSLIHGDMHTGSVFIKEDSTKVIDGEFAFYGPAGYDLGNVVANLIFAWANADTTMTHPEHRKQFTGWLEETIRDVMRLFVEKWKKRWEEKVSEVTARYDGFAEWYLSDVLADTAGVAGLELCRRTVGIAHVKDLTSIENEEQRTRAERLCLAAAKRYILKRDSVRTGEDYLAILADTAGEYPRPGGGEV